LEKDIGKAFPLKKNGERGKDKYKEEERGERNEEKDGETWFTVSRGTDAPACSTAIWRAAQFAVGTRSMSGLCSLRLQTL